MICRCINKKLRRIMSKIYISIHNDYVVPAFILGVMHHLLSGALIGLAWFYVFAQISLGITSPIVLCAALATVNTLMFVYNWCYNHTYQEQYKIKIKNAYDNICTEGIGAYVWKYVGLFVAIFAGLFLASLFIKEIITDLTGISLGITYLLYPVGVGMALCFAMSIIYNAFKLKACEKSSQQPSQAAIFVNIAKIQPNCCLSHATQYI